MTSPTVEPRRARWPWVVLAAAVLLAAAAWLALRPGPVRQPAAAATSQPPATSAALATTAAAVAAVDDRATCRANAAAGNGIDLDPDTNLTNGQAALQSTDPGIADAGGKLVMAAFEAQRATDTAGAALDIREAQRGLAAACGARFGDGPW